MGYDKESTALAKETLMYGFGVGANRGTTFLFLPFLTSFLSIGEFGSYVLIMTAVQLATPLISFNSSAAVMREGSDSLESGRELTNRFNAIVYVMGGACAFACWEARPWVGIYPLFVVSLGAIEANQSNILTYLRCGHQVHRFLAYSLLRTGIALCVVLYCMRAKSGLEFLLQMSAVTGVVLSVLVPALEGLYPTFKGKLPLRAQLAYSVPLIPHMFGLWIMNGSDKYVVELLRNNAAVGRYGIAYSLGMAVMLLNSGIALALPTYFIQNSKLFFKEKKGAHLYYSLYTMAYLAIVFGLFGLVKLDKMYGGFLKYYEPQVILSTALVAFGFFFLGLYYLYVNVLFYFKRSMMLSSVTMLGALFNVVLTLVLVWYVGYPGAAAATMVTYAAYLTLVWARSRSVCAIMIDPVQPLLWITLAGAGTFTFPWLLGLL